MFLNNRFWFIKIFFVLAIAVVLFGVGQRVLAQTPSCTSPLTNNPVSDAQFVADAKTTCTQVGRTDTDACVAEMRSTFCTSAQTPGTSNNNSNIGAGVMGLTFPVAGMAIKVILYILNVLVGVLISFAGFLTGWALEFNLSILNFSPSFMMVGWTIFRDIANLGFVLGIIIIAIATILRYKDYTAKQILWKLIVAALIVNFSLVIGGAFITISNSVSQYLLNAMGSNDGGTIAKIGDAFGYTKLVTEVSDWGSGWQIAANTLGFGDGASLGVIVSLAVILIFGIVFLFTLLAYAGMLVLRYFNLVFLLIVSPVVWLLWIFPSTKKYFGEWWSNFLHWIQYAPFVLIFTYISLTILQAWASYQSVIEGKLGSNFALFGVIGGNSQSRNLHFGTLMVALVACAMLIGGLKMAQKMGYGGTKMILGGFDKATGKTKKWAQSRAKWIGSRVGAKTVGQKSVLGRNIQKGLVKVGSNQYNTKFGKFVGKGLNIASGGTLKKGAAEAAQQFAVGQAKLEKGSQKLATDAYKKNLEDLSPDQLIQLLPTLNTNEQTAALNILASKNKLGELDIIGNKQHRETVLGVMNNMNKIGLGKDKGDLEKKIGTNEDMLKAWNISGKDGSFVKKLTKKDGSPDLGNDGKQKEMKVTFSDAAEKFFKDFGKEDYKNFAKNYGKVFEKPEKTEEQKAFFNPFISNIATTDLGTGMSSFSSALKNEEQRKGFYTDLVRSISENINPIYRIQLNPILDTIQPDNLVKPRKLEQRDFDEVVEILKSSGNPAAKKLADKIHKSVASQLTGSEEEEEEKKGKQGEETKEVGK